MQYKIVDKKYYKLIQNIEYYFNKPENKILYNKRNIVKIVMFDSKPYVIKSFKIPHLINQIVYRFLRKSKAKRSCENSIYLKNLNINTPKAIGYIECNNKLTFKKSFYISELFDFDFEIRDVFNSPTFEDRKNILKEFIAFTYNLHQKGIFHIDYSPGNILIKKVGIIYEFYIIDVNRMKFIQLDTFLRMKNLSRLTTNVKDNKLMIDIYANLSNIKIAELEELFQIELLKEKKYLANKRILKSFKK